MKTARLAFLALACSLPLAAAAQWQWVDNTGRRVFSDQPPPADIAPNRIVKQPGQRAGAVAAPAAVAPAAGAPGAATPAAAGTTTAAAPGAAVPRPSGKDPALEEKRKQAEAAENAKKKAEDEKFASQRAENCKRAKENKAMLDSGVRVARTNDKGEREFMDDAQRAAEGRKLQEVIGRDCPNT